MLTAAKSRGSTSCGSVAARVTDWQALALYLLCEQASGCDSFWAPYIAALPDQLDHPLLWPEACRRALLKGSPMLGALERRLQIVDEDYKAIMSAGGGELTTQEGQRIVTSAGVRWASATLLSRCFSLALPAGAADGDPGYELSDEDETDPQPVLVPWADMLNHSGEAGEESVLRFDPRTMTASLSAHRSYEPGEQVFDSYGPGLSPTELLLDYGFVDSASCNHRAQLNWRLVATPRSKLNDALMSDVEKVLGGVTLVMTPSGLDSTGLACLRAAMATKEQLAALGWSGPGDDGGALMAMAQLSEPSKDAQWEAEVAATAADSIGRVLAGHTDPCLADMGDVSTLGPQRAEWVVEQASKAMRSERCALAGSKQWLEEAAALMRGGLMPKRAYGH